jgi:TIR domain
MATSRAFDKATRRQRAGYCDRPVAAGQQPGQSGGAAGSAQPDVSEIFLSYAGADRSRIAPLVHCLEAEGLQLWWDRDIGLGQTFHKVIEQALAAAPCVIVVWTRESVQSEWVLNEASDARKRDRLVPVLLDPVTPPLEFRHLQAADLSDWKGDSADPRFSRLHEGLVAMLGRSSDDSRPSAHPVLRPRKWAPMWRGWTMGSVALGVGVSVILLVLWQTGLIGPATQPVDSVVGVGLQSSGGREQRRQTGIQPDAVKQTQESIAPSQQPPLPNVPVTPSVAPARERVNLLDTENSAQLVTTNQSAEIFWRTLFTGMPTTTFVYVNSFAVLALRGDQPATFDTLAVFVDKRRGSMSVKELALYTSSTSPGGPFVKTAQITVPDYQDLRKPFHEFRFAPVRARFVKLEVLSFHALASGNVGFVGSIQLYASDTTGSASPQ